MLFQLCACSSVDRAVASDAMCAGSTPVRRTSAERARAVHVAARKLAHFLQKVYSAFAYGSVIDSVTVKQCSACAPRFMGALVLLAHSERNCQFAFAYGSVICSAHTGRSEFSDFFYTRDPVGNSIKSFRPGFSAFTKCGNTGIGAFLFLREYVIYFIYV